MSARPMYGVTFQLLITTGDGVLPLRRNLVKEDVAAAKKFRLVGGSKTQDLNFRADVFLSISRGPPGQWFPETEY